MPADSLPTADLPSVDANQSLQAEAANGGNQFHSMQNQQLHRYKYTIPRRTIIIAVSLFIACCLSTFFVGSRLWLGFENGFSEVIEKIGWSTMVWDGLLYAVPVMLILLAHEMGHFLQALRYSVPATPPFFIPMPLPPLGTMGAVIIQQRGVADRKATFDIAITGPLAGLVLALPIAWFAISNSTVVEIPPWDTYLFGEPLILQWMIEFVHGPIPEGMTVDLGSVGLAGWVGIFITALNLIPIGQLDGGHLLYCLLGKRAHTVAQYMVGFAVGYMVGTNNYTYAIMLALIVFIGAKHPETADDTVPLGTTRIILGWLTLAFIIIGFTPVPLAIG